VGEGKGLPGRPGVLAVSNFTVYGDASQRRPSFVAAAPYERGEELFDAFVAALRALGVLTQTGTFGADMKVTLTNDGPVTIVVDC
jgi:D-tyrosyl-tRNA(Tyr) deacylase